MLAWILTAYSIFRPLEFAATPPYAAVLQGRAYFEQNERIDRAFTGSREVLGRWFDGRVHQEADVALWLSPEALAGWYGWLAARDSWTNEQLLTRWAKARESLVGKIVFLVRVNAFPKEDPLELGSGRDADPNILGGLSFRLSFTPSHAAHYDKRLQQDGEFVFQPSGAYVATSRGVKQLSVEKRESHEVLEPPIYHQTSMAPLFMTEGDTDEPDDGIPIGDYYGATYLVSFSRPAGLALCPSMKLEVIRPHRIKSVTFDLLVPRKPVKVETHFLNKTISAGGAQN